MFVVGSLPFYLVPRALGLLKIGGRGASVKATLRSTLRSMCAWAHSLPAVRGPPRARPPQPLPDGRSGAPTPYDLDASVIPVTVGFLEAPIRIALEVRCWGECLSSRLDMAPQAHQGVECWSKRSQV